MPFASGPVLAYIGLGRYRTVGPTEYVGRDDVITIDDGFETDLASVPRLFWAVLPPTGVYEKAATVHDFGCDELNAAHREHRTPWITSRDNDGLFRRIAREGGTGWLTRWLLWTGVRWGALANPARRAGWWRDAPFVLGISVALLAVLSPGLLGLHLVIGFLIAAVSR